MIRLLDLFPNLTATWPRRFSRDAATLEIEGGDPDLPAFVAELSAALQLEDVVYGHADGVSAIEAKVRVQPTTGDHLPIVDAELAELTFKLLPTTGAFAHLRIAIAAGPPPRVTVTVDGLAVLIEFSVGTLMPPLPASGPPLPEKVVGAFEAGQLDSFAVTYRDSAPSDIAVHVRVTVDGDGAVTVLPAVPIVLGPCRFLGMPVIGIYDLTPILSPERARDTFEWLRHGVVDELSPFGRGLLAMRQLSFDPNLPPLKMYLDLLNDAKSHKDATAELVLEDLVLPQGLAAPFARHFQVGIRRNVVDYDDLRAQFDFATAPVRLAFFKDPTIGLIVNYLSLRSSAFGDPDGTEGEAEWPVTFDAAFFMGDGDAPRNAVGLTFEEHQTALVTYLRSLDATGGDTPVLDYKLFGIDLNVFAIRCGTSFEPGRDFGESFVLAADIAARDTESTSKKIRLEGLDGKPVAFLLERVGWWFGPSIGPPAIPDGVQVVLFDKFRLLIQEVALIGHPSGGHYLAISGGIAVPKGKASVRRARFKIGGNPDAPEFGADGFFLTIDTSKVKIDAGGAYTEEIRGDLTVKEFTFTGSFRLELRGGYGGGVDVVAGSVSGAESFSYFLGAVFVDGRIPLGGLILRSARGLYANDMRPRLEASDLASRDLRYLAWAKRTDPHSLGGDRRTNAWVPSNGSWGFGLGAGGNFAAFGETCRLEIFALVLDDEAQDATILFLAGDLYILNNLTKPIAYLAIEVDLDDLPNFSAMLGVEIGPDQFVTNPPDWLTEVARITATIFVATDPPTLAIGRLDDPRTWATLRVKHQIFGVEGWFEVQLCLELSRDAKGFAFALRVGGKASLSIFHFDFYLGLGFIIATFETGSTTEGHCVWAEGGFQFRIWKWFRFSAEARIEVRGVGQEPSYGLASARIRISTPWYLPDVTFKYSWTMGSLRADELAASRRALGAAAAFSEATGASTAIHVTPFDAGAADDATRVRSIDDLRAVVVPPREVRAARAFTGAGAVAPVGTDATIQLAFAVPVTDAAAVGSPVPQRPGDQASGELAMAIELIGMSVRRRPRFEPGAAWVDLCDRVELVAIPDGAGGFTIGSYDPLPLTAFWEPQLIDGETAAQRLLLNATTPFTFGMSDPDADDALAEAEPGWPCCSPKRQRTPTEHVLDFAAEPLGDPLRAAIGFPATRTTLHATRSADVRVSIHAGGVLPAGTRAARWSAGATGVLFRIVAERPAAWVDLWVSWPARPGGALVLTGLDAGGDVVAVITLPFGAAQPPARQRLSGAKPIATVIAAARGGLTGFAVPIVELTRAAYVGHADLEAWLRRDLACKHADHGALAGQGKVGFLPNHDYEIELRTRITLRHPSADPEAVETTELAYFRTKGLPGLNAVPEVGAELRPHVMSEYPDRGAPLYREESLIVAFDDRLGVIVPLASRPPRPASPERDTLLELQLTARPSVARETGTPFTAGAPDWLTAHRTTAPPPRKSVWRDVEVPTSLVARTAITTDVSRFRLAHLMARPEACVTGNPLLAPSGVLVAPPPADPALGVAAWPAQADFEATVSPKPKPDAQGPVVHREAFDPTDLTALRFAGDTGPIGGAAWTVTDGALVRTGSGRQVAVLGNEQWNHFTVDVAVAVTGAAGGVAIALPHAAAGAVRGLFALIERDGAATFLAIRRRVAAGGALEALARTAITPGDGPIALAVTAFDDRIRAQVGDVVVEADREAMRDGCLGLVTDGGAAFHTLSVRGVPMYRFPFTTSRYRTFADHVASWSGVLGEVTPASIGVPEPPPSQVATLYAATVSRIAAAMAARALASDRDALFAEWVQALALPLRTEVAGVELTRYELGGATRLLLLESPEPLRFSRELEVTLSAVGGGGGGGGPGDWLDDLRDLDLDLLEAAVVLPRPPRPPGGRFAVVHAVLDDRGAIEHRVYAGRAERTRRGGGLQLRARRAADIRVLDPAIAPAIGPLVSTLRPGGVALVDLDALEVLGEVYPFDPVPPLPLPPPQLAVLTDGAERRAVLIPIRAGAAVTLEPRRWRLGFALDRERWREAASPPSPASRLVATAALAFAWT